jgi:hypothetical protein
MDHKKGLVNMHIRPATARDLHRLAEITVTSLKDDPAFDFTWSRWRQYPEDNFFFWQLKLEKWLYSKKTNFIVMVLDAEDPGPDDGNKRGAVAPGTVISYCIWARNGKSDTAKKIWREKNTWLNKIDSCVSSFPHSRTFILLRPTHFN